MKKNIIYNSGDKILMKWINWGYSLPIFLGVLFAFLTVCFFWKRYKYSWEFLQILVIITIPSALIGAKLYTLIVENDGWSNWYKLEGLSIYGVIIFSIISGSIFTYFRRHVVDFRTVISIVIPTILIGQSIGRWGNFFNHEVYGEKVSSASLDWMGSLKAHMYIRDIDGSVAYRAPIFFYESISSLVGYILIVWVLNFKSIFKPGATAGIYAIWYGITRLILQKYRASSQTSWIDENNKLSINWIISIIMIIIGVILFIWWQFLTKPFDKKTKRILPSKFLNYFRKEYEIIYPVKEIRYLFFGSKSKHKGKYFLFFGPKVENKIKLYIPTKNDVKWSKRELNSGIKNKKSQKIKEKNKLKK